MRGRVRLRERGSHTDKETIKEEGGEMKKKHENYGLGQIEMA